MSVPRTSGGTSVVLNPGGDRRVAALSDTLMQCELKTVEGVVDDRVPEDGQEDVVDGA